MKYCLGATPTYKDTNDLDLGPFISGLGDEIALGDRMYKTQIIKNPEHMPSLTKTCS